MTSTSGSDNVPQLPNPFTPMAFLPPELAYQVTVSTYVFVASLSILLWDVLSNLYEDYRLLTHHSVRLPTVVYFISRILCLGHVLGAVIFQTAPTGNCVHFEIVLDWIYPAALSFTALLFFLRVRAIFGGNKLIVTFFAFMWLVVVGGSLTTTQGIAGINIASTNYCISASMQPYVAAAAIIPLVNDTFVFLAITWKLMGNAHAPSSIGARVRTLAFGDYLPTLSRALLQDGQAYYLTTVSTSLMTVIMLYIKTVPVVYRTMFTVPNLVLMNIMACRVFRNVKFGIFREAQNSSYKASQQRSGGGATNVSIPLSALQASSLKAEGVRKDVGAEDLTTVVGRREDSFDEDVKAPSQGHPLTTV